MAQESLPQMNEYTQTNLIHWLIMRLTHIDNGKLRNYSHMQSDTLLKGDYQKTRTRSRFVCWPEKEITNVKKSYTTKWKTDGEEQRKSNNNNTLYQYIQTHTEIILFAKHKEEETKGTIHQSVSRQLSVVVATFAISRSHHIGFRQFLDNRSNFESECHQHIQLFKYLFCDQRSFIPSVHLIAFVELIWKN